MTAVALGLALILAMVHLVANRLRFLHVIPRSRWLSLSGGVAVAYVFVQLLPELAEGQQALEEEGPSIFEYLERHVYLLALLGLSIFYGLERAAKRSGGERRETEEDSAGERVFWLHMGSYGIYNILIGYLLLHREQPGIQSLLSFGVAMALHFLTNSYGLRMSHKDSYDALGRWLLAAAVLLGWVLGVQAEVGEAVLALLFSFLAGAVVLNVLKEELPEERQSRFWPFAFGAVGYAALLLLA
ncbi:MAG: hypothetical protein M3N51_01655 [Actinomycetota bacterium]|nr:hypothetical protein [Actinomycetota bacterium]